MRDKELQKLVDQAAKAREVQLEREAKRPGGAKPEPAPPNPVRLGVYARMWKGGPHLLWFLPLSVFLPLVVISKATWLRYAAAVYGVAFGLRVVWYFVQLLRGYAAFKRFPADLRTKLEGWYPMLDETLINDPEQWQAGCELVVTVDDGADSAPVAAALELFVPRANSWYYTPDSIGGAASDPRTKWTREGTRVSGSLNVWILGELYKLINQLDWIHARAGGIAKIAVKKSGGVYSLSRPSAD